jgi:hypothetical protein
VFVGALSIQTAKERATTIKTKQGTKPIDVGMTHINGYTGVNWPSFHLRDLSCCTTRQQSSQMNEN